VKFVRGDEARSRVVEYVQGMKNTARRLGPLAQEYWFDALIMAGLGVSLAYAVVEQHNATGPDGPLWFDMAATFVFFLPMLARRRFPFGAPVASAVAIAAASFVDGALVSDNFVVALGGIAVALWFGMLRERRQAIAGLAIEIGALAIVFRNAPDFHGRVGAFIFNSVVFSVAWVVGIAIGHKFEEADEAKERAARAEREREERARLAVEEERTRIARELHDIVGHSVSVMTVQASAVRRLLKPEQEREREALEIVEQTGREALAEMRRLVGVLRRPEEAPALAPQPSLEHLGKLVEQAREAGLPVELRIEGKSIPLSPGVDLTGYRLVQEGLTNAVKHAGAAGAQVLVRYGNGEVEIVVSDDGDGSGDGEKGGHGLVGMRERVAVYGGELEAGPRAEGGYVLRARLPVENGHE
jgi:signal transduction histidine kinase